MTAINQIPCAICGKPMNAVGYSGVETCPNCEAQFQYDEGVTLIIDEAIRKAILAELERRKKT